VATNLPQIDDESFRRRAADEAQALAGRARDRSAEVLRVLAAR
jgi:hypothetical protein